MRPSLRLLLRRFQRAPAFTIISLLTLALGIGATTAMFAVVNGVLLKPLPYADPERLVGLWHVAPGLLDGEVNQSPALHFTYRDESRVLEDLGMWSEARPTVTGRGEPERVDGMLVTDGTLRLLGVAALRGRIFSREDDAPGAPRTTVISWHYWQTRLGANPDVVGTTITVDGRQREIIGVLPRGFRLLDRDAALYLPLQFDPAETILGNFSYQGIGRLRPGATIAQANEDLHRLLPVAAERFPRGITLQMMQEARFAPAVRPLAHDVIGDIAGVLWVLLGTVGIVLLIACANVANLFLVRAEGRYREIAVRTALGATRGRIAADFLGEGLALGLMGGVAGLALAAAGLRLLHATGPEQLPRLHDISIDARVFAAAALLSLTAGALLSLLPMLRHARDTITAGLRDGARGGEGRERHRARNVLVVAQLALALVLLAGSGLMVRSAPALRAVHPGFEAPADILTFRLSIPSAEVQEPEAVLVMHERIRTALAEVPGVARAGLVSAAPMDGSGSADPIDPEDFPTPSGQLAPIRRYMWVAPGWFETMGTPIVAGRDITQQDLQARAPVVVLSESLAREYWGDARSAIGRRVRNVEGRPWREVVGVARDISHEGVDQPPPATAYWPLVMQDLWDDGVQVQRSMTYTLRLERAFSPDLAEDVRRAVWSVNANLPVADLRTLDQLVDRSMARTSFTLLMLGIAAAVALLLGAVGLYGVISYTVALRTREFGVRMALGARAADVGRLVLRHAALLVGIGLGVGIVASFAATRIMAALLFGVAPGDPLTLAAVAALLAVIGLAASLVPVIRAARVEPIGALRGEGG
jgi:predicted permease